MRLGVGAYKGHAAWPTKIVKGEQQSPQERVLGMR